jgi:hypothetical protein
MIEFFRSELLPYGRSGKISGKVRCQGEAFSDFVTEFFALEDIGDILQDCGSLSSMRSAIT